jgi:1,4-alpha-glucan branching enzyme
MPYVRKNGFWPCGEEWLLEAWAETYIPLLDLLREMLEQGWGKLTLTLTPVLVEQLQDPYMNHRLQVYLENKLRQLVEEIDRFHAMGDAGRRELALYYLDYYQRVLDLWGARYRGRMLETLRGLREEGRLEVVASAATHAFLPLLGSEENRLIQARLGTSAHRELFGSRPAGFWLPECAFSPEMEGFALELSREADYVILDYSALSSGDGRTFQAQRIGETPLFAIFRDEQLSRLIWDRKGFPSHGPYREFSKRDADGVGIQYWKITSGETDLWHKQLYDPLEAASQARRDARDFLVWLESMVSHLENPEGSLLLACYDTELLGHWWFEGIAWLGEVLRLLEGHSRLQPCTCEEFIRKMAGHKRGGDVAVWKPIVTSWGDRHDFSTWQNENTVELWNEIHRCEKLLLESLSRSTGAESPAPLLQAVRECLLLEASDWSFMIGRRDSESYAWERFRNHTERFKFCLRFWEEGGCEEELARLQEQDNLFPRLTLDWLRSAHAKS